MGLELHCVGRWRSACQCNLRDQLGHNPLRRNAPHNRRRRFNHQFERRVVVVYRGALGTGEARGQGHGFPFDDRTLDAICRLDRIDESGRGNSHIRSMVK
jgi:hypothetical protein